MSKDRQRTRKKKRLAAAKISGAERPNTDIDQILRGPIGRALADQFCSSYPSVRELHTDRSEDLYETFAQLVEADIVRLRNDGTRVHITFHPEALVEIPELADMLPVDRD